MAARNILEIGTSNGYSTVWLASAAAAVGGRVTTIDVDTRKTQPLVERIRQQPGTTHVLVPVGKGELLVLKATT
ncbi:class I SAM-dependent methyltransferase [Archangium violaceum]|uniref:class I SAM-dependent methyltransferase n=1 Tax=Archangium violaceum TaxID=83451 RepID=UPI00193BF732|nr:class I SAM-dependent methyltransferase [Archangium violaceum]QRK05887.1 class I SAM-dependent methyltransferase [Archangium violaceum]